MRLAAALLCAVLTIPPADRAAAQEEQQPEFGALEDATLTHFVVRGFDAHMMPLGRFTRDDKPSAEFEGRVREFVYRLEDETSTLEAIRNYQRRFEELGYVTEFVCGGDECGGFDFRFGVRLVEPPAMRFDLADFRYLAVSDEAAGRHASVIASRQGGKLFVQVVAVEGERAPDAMTAAGDAPPPAAKPGAAQLFALARRLTDDGYAPLEGIEFEAGSATLIGSSFEVLAQAAQVLRGRPDLSFLVVGHTDAQGDFDLNLDLSRRRAEAVAARLAGEEGVEASQLIPHGVAFLAPRASNGTPEGRALNRRVELVMR